MKHTLNHLFMAALCISILGAPVSAARVRLIAVQMKVDAGMYRDGETFRAEMDRVVGDAARRRAKTCPTLVVLPEDTGLGLVFLGHLEAVKGAKTIREAGALLGQSMAPIVMANVTQYHSSPVRALLLAANDGWLRSTYYSTFSALAKKHSVYLAAGSAPLRTPGTGEVRNVAVLFGPDGKVLSETAKVHLIDLEGPSGLDLVPGRVEDLPVATTPFGKVGTAVCLDGFHDDVLDRLTAKGAAFILQPSFNPGPWSPAQEKDWGTGLWQRLTSRPGVVGINPMMTGRLWDIVCEGRSSVVGNAAPGGYWGRLQSSTEPGLIVVDVKDPDR